MYIKMFHDIPQKKISKLITYDWNLNICQIRAGRTQYRKLSKTVLSIL